MVGTTGLEPAASAVTEWKEQVLTTTYEANGDCQVLENTRLPNRSRVGVKRLARETSLRLKAPFLFYGYELSRNNSFA